MEVATITSISEKLTPADISSTTAVLGLLTDSAIADPEVQLVVSTISATLLCHLGQRSVS